MHRRPAAALLLMICCVFAFGQDLRADHCAGEDARPAVCTVDFYGGLDGERLRRFDSERALELPPGRDFDLELEAFDQHQRRFPVDRLAFGVDWVDCRELVEVKQTDVGRFTLRTGSRRGACDLWLWIPGDLNLEWRLEVVIESRSRSGYSRSEAEFISHRLYAALLGREVDSQGLRDTTAEIQRGNLSGRVYDMVRSSEFRARAPGMTPTAMLEQLYQGLLGRAPDSSGVAAFLDDLERGAVADVVRDMLESEEFESQLVAGTY